jgi:hypothetical protein
MPHPSEVSLRLRSRLGRSSRKGDTRLGSGCERPESGYFAIAGSGNNVLRRGARRSFARLYKRVALRALITLCSDRVACVRSLTGVVANGAMLSKMATSLLGNLGFDDVADLIDGYQAWATR